MRGCIGRAGTAACVALAVLAGVLGLATPARALDGDTFDDVAIIIGNKNYANGIAPVAYAHNDAEAMKRFVIDVLHFDPENVIVLLDATKNEMETHFAKGGILGDWIDPNGKSDVVVFYSGHGVPGLQDSNSYLLPVDGNPNKAEISGYPLSEFYANLKALKAKSVTVFLDACFSGDSGGGVLFRDASPVFQAARKTVAPAELTVMTASQADQIASWDREAKHGLFTEYLLNAIYGEADGEHYGNGDGKITMGEINAYLSRNMSRAARREFGRQQQPAFSGSDDTVLVSFPPGQPPARPQIALEGDGPAAPAAQAAASSPAPAAQAATPAQPAQPQAPQQMASLTPGTAAAPQLDPIDQPYITVKTSNVRDKPSVEGEKVTTLPPGTRVTALGKVHGDEWYLVAQDGKEVGYIYGSLVMPEKEGLAALAREQQQQQQQQAAAPSRPEMGGMPAGAPPPRQAGVTRVYLQGVTNNNGGDMQFVSDVVRNVVASMPGARLLGSSNMNDADVVVSGRVTRVDKTTMANPEAQGAAMATALFGNLGRAMTANVPQTVDVYRVEVMLSALDRHSGRTTIERGYHEEKIATGAPSGQAVGTALQAAASQAAQSLMVRMAGSTPPAQAQQQPAPQQNNGGNGLFNLFKRD